MIKLVIREQTCQLLSKRAVFWEEKKALILADIHLGKETVFRKAGIPIPNGVMEDDLLSVSHLVAQYKPDLCIIVGDLIHARTGISEEVRYKFSKWLKEIGCAVHLVVGNHDYGLLKDLPAEWHLSFHKEGLAIEPFYFSHFPKPVESFFVWSGHLHPKVEISNGYDRIVLRCFQIYSNLAVLPAFGFFVGGSIVKKSEDCKIYAIVDDDVIEV